MTTRYSEPGASRVWLWVAPVATGAVIATQLVLAGSVPDWWLWLLIGAAVELFIWLQVAGGRAHVGVALTPQTLRCGDETVAVAEIAEVLPGAAPDPGARDSAGDSAGDSGPQSPAWMTARAMGRLGMVPRRRYGVGLRLVDGSTVQAWAKDDYALREALAPLLAR